MKKIGILSAALAAAIGFGAVPAIAAQGADKAGKGFERFDTNKDGAVTRDEVTALRDAHFARLDANADGRVGRDEFAAAAQKRQAERAEKANERLEKSFSRLDANGDGFLGKDEGPGKGADWFGKVDANSDGRITREEADAAHAKLREKRQSRDKAPQRG